MGGAGTWALAAKHPDRVRGAIPIAAAPPPSDLNPAVPVYVIHSRTDESQPFERTEQAVRALEARGANVTLAALNDVPHRDMTQYIEPLAAAIPWIRRLWGLTPPA
jgi:pimeloyl-ACP methyl ester carboxylesterase